MQGGLSPLLSERDQNFRVEATDGRRYVLKIANRAEDPSVTLFQVEALRHIERHADADIPAVPRVVPTAAGASHVSTAHGPDRHIVRLVSWVDGQPLAEDDPSLALSHSIGHGLATLGRWLRGFRHPGENQSLLWDMKKASELRRHLGLLDGAVIRGAVSSALDDFDAIARPAMQSMRWQVIHNDLHSENLLVRPGQPDVMVGVIDFGDMLRSPLIVDLGVCAAYLRGDDEAPFAAIRAFVAGYQQITPLTAAELDLLYYLVRARLAATVCISRWRLSARAADDPYLKVALNAERAAADYLLLVNQFTLAEFRAQIGDA